MTDNPNLYELCLGIAVTQQPPSHYRLLDVQLFESNQATIQRAGERQALRARASAPAPHTDLLNALLAEIDTARQVLSNPHAREQYDRQLCAAIFPPAIARPVPPPPAPRHTSGRRIDPPAEAAPRGSVLAQIMSLLRTHERAGD